MEEAILPQEDPRRLVQQLHLAAFSGSAAESVSPLFVEEATPADARAALEVICTRYIGMIRSALKAEKTRERIADQASLLELTSDGDADVGYRVVAGNMRWYIVNRNGELRLLPPGIGFEQLGRQSLRRLEAKDEDGARRWLSFGAARFQPSELAKIALILVLAWYGERYQRQMSGWWKGFARPMALVGVVVGLIFLEPDWGTALLIGTVSTTMLIVAGVRWRYLLPAVIISAVILSYAIAHNPVRRDRVLAFLDPEKHKEGVGYQPWQGMLALGAGGWWGKGLGDSRQKLGFVPEHHKKTKF